IANTVTVAVPAGTTDPTPANNSATDTNNVTPVADLSVTKTDGSASVNAGGATSYTIVVTNNGPSDVTAATVVDTAPAGLTIGAWTCAVTTAGSGSVTTACGAASGSGNINTTATLRSGGVITYTVAATVAGTATGTIANTVTVAVPAGTTDPTPANNSATDTNTVNPVADLSVTKTDGAASVNAGGATSYTIVVTNNGPSDVTAATVVDTAPAGLTIGAWTCAVTTAGTGSVTTACGAASGSGNINTTATLRSGGVITYTVAATVAGTATGTIANTVTVAVPAGTTDPTPANNSATDTNTVNPVADLSVTKTDGAASVNAGGATSYTIVVTNNGPSDVTAATVVDTAPAGLTIGAWTCAVTTAGTGSVTTACGAASGSGNINTTATLRSGGVITYTVAATVAGTATGTIANTVTVAVPAGTTDPTPGNNSATDTNTVTPVANLAITKTDGVASVNAGGSTSYTIVVTNNGPSDVTAATIVDTAPAGLTIGAWTCSVTTAGVGSVTTACGAASGSGNINTTATLRNGGVVTYTVAATVAGTASGTIANTATVTAPAGTTDPTPANNSATDTDTITPVANLAITKTDGAASVNAGGATSYTIVVTNNGPSDVTAATVVDTAPAGLTIGAWTCAVTTAGTGSVTTACGAASGSGNINTTATLRSGGVITYTVAATIAGTATGTIANTVTVAVPAGTTDPTPGNNSATDTNNVTPVADLSVTKTDGAASVNAGGATSYTIVVTNNGPSDVTAATVVDTAPAGLTIGAWTCAVTTAGTGSVTTACGAASGSGNINTTATLRSGGVITYTVASTVAGTATGTIANTVTVAVPAGTTDPTPGNNSATDTNNVTPVADLSVTKTDGAASVNAGGATSYTIVVTNNGPSDVTAATVVDTAPAGLTIGAWTCAVTTAGTGSVTTACGAASGSGNINTTATLRSGGVITYTVAATVAGTATGTIANTVTVAVPAGTTDPTPGNNSATDTNTVTPIANLAITKTDGAASINAGGSTSYTIVITNNGPSDVTAATIVDTAPAGLTIGAWTCAVTTAGVGSVTTACGAASGSGNINTTATLRNGGVVT
ncbi:beta strand repeat-containing protein, partial [Arenimonas oryziterrae]